ncbi:MAG: dockerin type I repeat-containing protein [Clostridia bacterium]|nr:dockerin type I repeat-containing protein [Clostridia bacterium]
MKKSIALICALLLVFCSMPVFASEVIPAATAARTTLLDLSSTTSSTSSTAQGWVYSPTGNNGSPKLTLNSYGLASAHSAPIKLAPNTLIVVNGDCYIDNVYMNEKYDVISAACNGYLKIEGTGTLNLYANQFQGNCINKESGSASNHNDDLIIDGVTVNCFNTPHDMNTAFSNGACIYAYKSITIRNAVINAQYGRWGVRIWGETPIGGVTEDTADEILIENSTVNIENQVEDNGTKYETGIEATFGRVRVTGDSHVNIHAGHNSIYAYLSLVLEGGTLDVSSRPVGSGESYPLVSCDKFVVNNGVSHVRIAATKYPLTCVLKCKSEGVSVLGSELSMVYGTFSDGNYTPGTDPSTGLPVLEISGGSAGLLGDVNCDGVVDMADVSALSAYLLGKAVLTPQGIINAEASGNGIVDSSDISAVYQLIFSKQN